jgi:predicted DNA-binding protein
MDPFADIDLDSESVWLDGAWYRRDDLARRIKEMIEAGDFRVSRPSQALERLEAALGQAQVVAVRMPADLAQAASATAARLGRPVGHLVREAVAYYLAAAAAYGAAQQQADAEVQAAAPAATVEVELEAEAPAAETTFFKKAR